MGYWIGSCQYNGLDWRRHSFLTRISAREALSDALIHLDEAVQLVETDVVDDDLRWQYEMLVADSEALDERLPEGTSRESTEHVTSSSYSRCWRRSSASHLGRSSSTPTASILWMPFLEPNYNSPPNQS